MIDRPRRGARGVAGTEPAPRPVSTRGVIALIEDNCTSCMICARECPDWCIHIESHTEDLPPTSPRGRPRRTHVLDTFTIDWASCLYCGICVDVCPFDALEWRAEQRYAGDALADLAHDRGRLAGWVDTPR